MLLYLSLYCLIVFLCSREIRLCNLSQFLLCDWKLCVVWVLKHRILQLNCLFNNYNVSIPRSILFNSISMLETNTLLRFLCQNNRFKKNVCMYVRICWILQGHGHAPYLWCKNGKISNLKHTSNNCFFVLYRYYTPWRQCWT